MGQKTVKKRECWIIGCGDGWFMWACMTSSNRHCSEGARLALEAVTSH